MGGSPTGYHTLFTYYCVLTVFPRCCRFFCSCVVSAVWSISLVCKSVKHWRRQFSLTWSYDCREKGAGVIRDRVHPFLSPTLSPRRRWLSEASPDAAA